MRIDRHTEWLLELLSELKRRNRTEFLDFKQTFNLISFYWEYEYNNKHSHQSTSRLVFKINFMVDFSKKGSPVKKCENIERWCYNGGRTVGANLRGLHWSNGLEGENRGHFVDLLAEQSIMSRLRLLAVRIPHVWLLQRDGRPRVHGLDPSHPLHLHWQVLEIQNNRLKISMLFR